MPLHLQTTVKKQQFSPNRELFKFNNNINFQYVKACNFVTAQHPVRKSHHIVTAFRSNIHVHVHFSSLLSHPSETQISTSTTNTLVKAYVQSSLAQHTFQHCFQVCFMHNVKVQASSTHAASSRCWPSVRKRALCVVWT